MDDPTARGAANFWSTICEAIDGLLAATRWVLVLWCHGAPGGMVPVGRGERTPAQRLLSCSLCQHRD